MGQRKSRLAPAQPPAFTRVSKPPEPDVIALVMPRDTLSLRIQTASVHELLEMRRVAAQHGSNISTLFISIGSFGILKRRIELSDRLQHVDYIPVDWDALLVLLPRVSRLDLSEMPLTSIHVRKIVEAASTHCMELKELVLPTKVTTRGLSNSNDVEPLLRVLSEALKKWRARGFRHLMVASHSSALLAELVLAECSELTSLELVLCPVEGRSEALGYAFIKSLALSCPLLSHLTVDNIFLDFTSNTMTPSDTITNIGLLALSRLEALTKLQVRVTRVHGDALFKLLQGLATHPSRPRVIEIILDGPSSTEPLLKAFQMLITCLEATSPERLGLASSDILLRVVKSDTDGFVMEKWSRQYLSVVKPLVARVKAKHPKLRIRLTVAGLERDSFSQARHFWLYTASSTRTPSRDLNWGFDADPLKSFANLNGRDRSRPDGMIWDYDCD